MTSPLAPTTTPGRSVDRRRLVTFLGISAGNFLVLLDTSILNVALPDVQHDLGAGGDRLVELGRIGDLALDAQRMGRIGLRGLDGGAPSRNFQSIFEAFRKKYGVRVEVSGGVTLETVAAYARAGADLISVGALTHSAPAVDIGLDFT